MVFCLSSSWKAACGRQWKLKSSCYDSCAFPPRHTGHLTWSHWAWARWRDYHPKYQLFKAGIAACLLNFPAAPQNDPTRPAVLISKTAGFQFVKAECNPLRKVSETQFTKGLCCLWLTKMMFSMVALLDLGVPVESLFSLLNLTSLESHLKSLSQGALWLVPERQHPHPTAHSPFPGGAQICLASLQVGGAFSIIYHVLVTCVKWVVGLDSGSSLFSAILASAQTSLPASPVSSCRGDGPACDHTLQKREHFLTGEGFLSQAFLILP